MIDILRTIMDNYLVFIIIFIALIMFIFGNRLRGLLGELKSSNVLNKLPSEYKKYSDLMLYSDHRTHQIDNLVISKYGIFVIEMKNYQGKVVGNEFSDKWTQYIGSKKNKFYNPIKQNYGHMRCLSDILNLGMNYFIPVIVFSNETEIDCDTDYVINLKDLVKYILKQKRVMNIDVDRISEILEDNNITDRNVRNSHVKKLKKNVSKEEELVKKKICPKCGHKMIVKDDKYLKCTSCKYTKDL